MCTIIAQAIVANGLVFCSGSLPVNPANGEVVPGGVKEQAVSLVPLLLPLLSRLAPIFFFFSHALFLEGSRTVARFKLHNYFLVPLFVAQQKKRKENRVRFRSDDLGGTRTLTTGAYMFPGSRQTARSSNTSVRVFFFVDKGHGWLSQSQTLHTLQALPTRNSQDILSYRKTGNDGQLKKKKSPPQIKEQLKTISQRVAKPQ